MDKQSLTTDLFAMKLAGANATIREITQQGDCWRQIDNDLTKQNQSLYTLIQRQLKDPMASITFCGAGTSAYIGQILAEAVQQWATARVRFVATTDIVSRPDDYFSRDNCGLLISFARSGNSPESIDTADKVRELAPQVEQLNITCNPEGQLAKRQGVRDHVCLMPEQTHDRSFVMTSSFSTMLLFTYQLIARAADRSLADLTPVANAADQLCREVLAHTALSAVTQSSRLVYLGSNRLYGAAREAALKTLEMTAGQVVTLAETALGFRHGPKSIIDAQTTVCVLVSSNPYTQQFDRDIIIELLTDNQCQQIIAVAPITIANTLPTHDKLQLITLPESISTNDDSILAALHVLVAQLIGLRLAVAHHVSPDNPCPSGEVNRVVQGVTLYEFKPTNNGEK